MIDPAILARMLAGWLAIAAGVYWPMRAPAGNRGCSSHPDLQSDE